MYSITYCLLRSLVEHSCINPKSLTFGYLDEKPVDTGLMKFLGLCPSPCLGIWSLPLHSPPPRPLLRLMLSLHESKGSMTSRKSRLCGTMALPSLWPYYPLPCICVPFLAIDSYVMNSDYDLSLCGLCQHIVGPPPAPITFAPLALHLRPPILGLPLDEVSLYDNPLPSRSRSPQTLLKLVHHCLDPMPLSSISTISIAHHFLHDNIVAYSSRVLAFASSCSMLRPYDLNFAFASWITLVPLSNASLR
ncbi:hypothetical protein BHM03_00012974 [Ensete ventricosum]|nr:hypothetical protein BHM03_00012974 [Ensete ventricosum]